MTSKHKECKKENKTIKDKKMKKLTFLLATFLMASYANAQVVFGENEKEFVKSTSFSSGRQPKKDAKPYFRDRRSSNSLPSATTGLAA